jgi:hypothetical protein
MAKLDHLPIAVRNCRASGEWHVRTLGLRPEFEVPDQVIALQDEGDFTLFVEEPSPPAVEPSCVLYFQVHDVDALHQQFAAAQPAHVVFAPGRQL